MGHGEIAFTTMGQRSICVEGERGHSYWVVDAPNDDRAWRASNALPEASPTSSARTRLSPSQERLAAKAGALLGVAGLAAPEAVLVAVYALGLILFAAAIALRAALTLVGALKRSGPAKPSPSASRRPIYTLLIPLYREANCAAKIAAAMRALRYPADRLDVIFLTEEDDPETRAALETSNLPQGCRILIAPDGAPRTKPRALNYGLDFAEGAFVAVYDAEDLPHPDQLNAALAAFENGGETLACVQAPLKARNGRESWLASQWALEYDLQFGLLVPAAAWLGLPILLGGTSNHFRIDALRAVGGWDAWNVTEDADLGARLARLGWSVGSITPPTLEEAPEILSVWTAQRSRWIKGYIQTWMVLMRDPAAAARGMGRIKFSILSVQLSAAILSALVHGPLLLWVALCWLAPSVSVGVLDLWLMSAGYAVNLAAALAAPGRLRASRLAAIATLPLYWPVQTLAAVRAVYGWVRNPHVWAKTPHGLTAKPVLSPMIAFAE